MAFPIERAILAGKYSEKLGRSISPDDIAISDMGSYVLVDIHTKGQKNFKRASIDKYYFERLDKTWPDFVLPEPSTMYVYFGKRKRRTSKRRTRRTSKKSRTKRSRRRSRR